MTNMMIFVVLCFAGAAMALPTESKHRWTLVPDGDGKMHLMDMNPVDIVEPETFFVPEIDVFFVLFTRRNPTAGQRISRSIASIIGSQWSNTAAGTRFIIHGWNNDHTSPVATEITSALLASADHNVVAVDWGRGAREMFFIRARILVPDVADQVAGFIDWLHQNGFLIDFNRLILTGHSLGAHVAGLVGKRLTRGRAQAIFALDPAGPFFSLDDVEGRLAAGDAVYTEMISTNSGVLGFDRPLAHATFYPNWGSTQPGCENDNSGACAHARAINIFAESITSNQFRANLCTSHAQIVNRNCPTGQNTVTMGGDAHKTLNGVFFLETNAVSPFARG